MFVKSQNHIPYWTISSQLKVAPSGKKFSKELLIQAGVYTKIPLISVLHLLVKRRVHRFRLYDCMRDICSNDACSNLATEKQHGIALTPILTQGTRRWSIVKFYM